MFMRRIAIIVAVVWALAEIVQNSRQVRSGVGRDRRDRGSLLVIYGSIMIGYALAIPLSSRPLGRIRFGYPFVEILGLVLTATGLFIRWNAMKTLEKEFTHFVSIRSEAKLITTGLYRTIRHPAYAGELLAITGIGLALGNWLSMLALFAAAFLALSYRMAVEEKALVAHFGRDYEDYRKRTKRLIPGIY
jgi:protein-S-isoprenylcysteine O-methyltransferase Ste14